MRPQMTAQQAEGLAGFLVTLRPGQRSWTKAACMDALAAAAMQRTNDAELLTRAAVRAALTPSIKTPSVIAMQGAHWDAVGAMEPEQPRRPGRRPCCGGFHVDPPDDDPRALCTARMPNPAVADHAKAARAAIKRTKTYLSTPLAEGETP